MRKNSEKNINKSTNFVNEEVNAMTDNMDNDYNN